MTKTLTEQQQEIAQVSKLIQDGNALANKLGGELKNVRTGLEFLRGFQQPDAFTIELPYSMRTNCKERACMRETLDIMIKSINDILGDRA